MGEPGGSPPAADAGVGKGQENTIPGPADAEMGEAGRPEAADTEVGKGKENAGSGPADVEMGEAGGSSGKAPSTAGAGEGEGTTARAFSEYVIQNSHLLS